jgi:uncharacterized protein YbbC (DUF1343 family)
LTPNRPAKDFYTRDKKTVIHTGIERLCSEKPAWAKGRAMGLLCNQASVDSSLRHSRFVINNVFPGQLQALFTPQHGLFSEKQDNMKESGHEFEPELGIPIFSLYEMTRTPAREQLDLIDILLVDLQDVGTRVYTYIWTMLLAMKACAAAGVAVAVLDRPNPVGGGLVEGNILDEELHSFVGMAPIPMRHGLTIGELAIMFRSQFRLALELHVVKMEGWNRNTLFPETGLPWVLPSPNVPVSETAMVYPGQVILEGTNLSEGRGTTRPFEIFGAPYLDTKLLLRKIPCMEGIRLREQFFEPTFNKWHGKRCRGFQIHITDPGLFRPYRFTLGLLSSICRFYPENFSWTPPPYEYEYERLPADLIIGSRQVRKAVESGAGINEIDRLIARDEEEFRKQRRDWLLYPETSPKGMP